MPKGFSFIELLIVIAVIGMIMAISIPAYNNLTARSAIASAVNTLLPLKGATDIYILDTGQFPNLSQSSSIGVPTTSLGNINLLPNSSGSGTIEFIFSNNISNTNLQSKKFIFERNINGNWKCRSYNLANYVDVFLMPKGCGG